MSNLVRLVTTDRLITVKELLGCGTSNMRALARAHVCPISRIPRKVSRAQNQFSCSLPYVEMIDPKAAVVRFGRTSETRKQRIRRARFLLPPPSLSFRCSKRTNDRKARGRVRAGKKPLFIRKDNSAQLSFLPDSPNWLARARSDTLSYFPENILRGVDLESGISYK